MIEITVSSDKADQQTGSQLYAEEKWGFHLTGGLSFSMPIMVFEVLPGSIADTAGIRCGDCILKINGKPLEKTTLDNARRILQEAGDDLRMQVAASEGHDTITVSKDVRAISLSTKVKEAKKEVKEEKHFDFPVPPKQPWHPVMWPQLRGDDEEKLLEAKPHARIIKNVKRFFNECRDPEERQKIIERMLLSLPTASKHKEFDPEEEEEERRKLAELRRLSLQMRGELDDEENK